MKHTGFRVLPDSWWVAAVSYAIIALALLYYTWRTGKK